jgi:hypothetical protein
MTDKKFDESLIDNSDDAILGPSRNADTFFVNRVEDRVSILMSYSLIEELRDFMDEIVKEADYYDTMQRATSFKSELIYRLKNGEKYINHKDEEDDEDKERKEDEDHQKITEVHDEKQLQKINKDTPDCKRQRLF